jgi:fimbrial isopeptide formation D2 family protein/LPXTG-motif cell wall-anchored protein
MKNINKLFALLLAVIMVVAMAAPVFAEETTHKITMSYSQPGHTYEAYQIFSGELSNGKLIHIEWGNGVNGEAIIAALKADKTLGADFAGEITTAEQVANILTNYENDSAKIEAFGRIVAANLTNKVDTECVMSGDKAPYTYTITVPGDGYYLVKDAGAILQGDAATKYILQVLGDVTIDVKADFPTLDKSIVEEGKNVDLNEVFVGDKIDYVLTSKVPAMDGYKSYFFVIHDTMSAGLTFNNDVAVKINGNALTAGTDFTVEFDESTNSFQIILKNFIQYKGLAGKAIEITYSATLNENAVIGEAGNPNVAYLVYSNNPNQDAEGLPENPDKPGKNDGDITGKTPEDEVITYTSGIKLMKVDTSKAPLTGAKFQIKGFSEKAVIISEKIYEVAENGTYYRLKDGTYTETAPTEETLKFYDSDSVKYNEVTVVTQETVKTNIVTDAWVDENGIITFEGLGAGEFTIEEMVAPEGYNKLTQPIKIVIEFNKDATPKWSATYNGKNMEMGEDNLFSFQVENKAGATLPSTGGIGTTVFYVVGAILVLGAVVMLITKKRMSNEA